MTQITAKAVQELRKATDGGLMACKKALQEADGDFDKAVQILKEKGETKAAKKADCVAAEGLISLATTADNTAAVLVEINCQTDFVAREESLVAFANEVANQTLTEDLSVVIEKSEAKRLELVSKLGENISVRREAKLTAPANGIVAAYLHTGGAAVARIGSLIALDNSNIDIAKDLAMQVAAMQPDFLSEADIPQEIIAKETDSITAQVKEQHPGKPEEMIAKIVSGKVAKHFAALTLLGQPFVKESSMTVKQYLDQNKTNVTGMKLLVVGAGIEKKQEDFASEVMAQVAGNR